MSEFRTRRRMSHPFRLLACLAALVMVLGVVFAGIGSAEESGGGRPGGLGSTTPLGEQAGAVGETERYYTRPGDRRDEPPSPDSDGARARDDARAERDGARAERADSAARSARSERDENRRDDNHGDDNHRDDNRDESGESPNDLYVPDELADELVAGTPCTKQAVACVSLGAKKSWLFTKDANGDTVIDRTVSVSTGGPGKETPVGDFVVEWKHKDHKSSEFFVPHGCTPGTPGCEGAPMNWAVFFAQGGIAFHQGTLNQRSSGCVRLTAADAEYYYTFLQIGNKVEVRA